ncbi:hypothetical protein [Microbulbifer litoralis]|uniref:hypothetical protein n=1 Tax=Microbulbifer litoralis TaxID=2933965 RepID=UPI002028DC2E|nr:hypothetical protein [Microbulbifer sp. GX H0434]
MHLDINAASMQGSNHNVRLTSEPDLCPTCHKSIHPKHVTSAYIGQQKKVQSVFRCTSSTCQELIIATYTASGEPSGARPHFYLVGLAPISPKKEVFSSSISEVSPSFVDIYNQALHAESENLPQLVGIGLRKALEFLVKDFLIYQKPENTDSIKRLMLGKCISDHIDDQNVKACALRAAWLGNDETHYIRKWEEQDITDLKLLVRLTVNWMENVLLTEQYIDKMST